MTYIRWIRDDNPEQSPKDRVQMMLNAIANTKVDGNHVGHMELVAWLFSELNSLYFKIEEENAAAITPKFVLELMDITEKTNTNGPLGWWENIRFHMIDLNKVTNDTNPA